MVGALVIVVGIVLTAVGISLGTFKPLPGYESPIPVWLAWSAAGVGLLTIAGGVVKVIVETRTALEERRQAAVALRRQQQREAAPPAPTAPRRSA